MRESSWMTEPAKIVGWIVGAIAFLAAVLTIVLSPDIAGVLPDGRPVGIQLGGPRFDDVGVLRAVAWFEGARPTGAR